MQILILFVLCFFLVLYDLFKLKQNRWLRRLLENNGILLSITILVSILVAIFRNYLFGYIVYITMFYLAFDFICFLLKHINPKRYHQFRKFTGDGIWIFAIAVIITTMSSIHVRNIVITKYEVEFEKEMKKDYRLMLITDMHLGTATKESVFDRIEESITTSNPDCIIFAGDIFDESTSPKMMEVAYQRLGDIASRNTVYFVLGNHEYVRGNVKELIEELGQLGVRVLVDETVFVDDSFYLIGRMDKYNSIVSKESRDSLEELLENVNHQYPIILVDHQPVELVDAKEKGIDLVLSGHTHAGQFFPLSFFAYFLNERLYGMKVEPGEWVNVESQEELMNKPIKQQNSYDETQQGFMKQTNHQKLNDETQQVVYQHPFYTIVSSGIGAWGMAMRNASDSEIVIIQLTGQ